MKIVFLGQGLKHSSNKSVGNLIIKYLQNQDFDSFTCFVAFVSEVAIKGIGTHIYNAKKYIKNIKIIAGVDLKGTSKEAVEELLSLNVESFVYYTKSRIIYHPKIYIFEGNKSTGTHALQLEAYYLKPGLHLIKLVSDNKISYHKIILSK